MDNLLNALPGADITPLARCRPAVQCARPLLAFVGASGSGKTTLIEALLPSLIETGLRIAVVKHAHCGFDIDRPGKDTHRAATAGAAQVVIGSRDQWAVMGRLTHAAAEPSLEWLIGRLDLDAIDIVLAEGFHFERCPKVEVYRPSLGKPPLCASDPDLVAFATDAPFDGPGFVDLNDIDAIADLVRAQLPGATLAAAV
jgi:molybdopterin-guanine dinucleotide biosynthesis adapter protein